MRSKLLLLLAAVAFLPLVGCSSSQVVRGQGPGNAAVTQGAEGDDCYYVEYCEDCECRRCRRHQCTPYSIPHDLSYPPHGDMPGIVQYPYYTHKGPDCFFHDSDGKR